MADILTKTTLPGTGAVPGVPGIPPTPGYSYTIYENIPSYTYAPPATPGGPGWTLFPPGTPGTPGNSYGIGDGPPGYLWEPPSGSPLTPAMTYTGYTVEATTINVGPSGGSPGIPGTPASPANFQLGWNSSAVSINAVTSGNALQFTIPAGVIGVVVGLATTDIGTNYGLMPWSLYFTDSKFTVYEKGMGVGVSFTAFLPTDVFSIVFNNGTVTYLQNSTIIRTSTITTAANANLFANAVMYSGGDAVNNAAIVSNSTLTGTGTGSCSGVLFGPCGSNGLIALQVGAGPVACFGQLNYNWTNSTCSPAETWLIGGPAVVCNGILTPLTDTAISGSAICCGTLTGLTTDAEGGFAQPQYAIVQAALTPLSVISYGEPVVAANCQGVLFGGGTTAGLYGFATNTTGAYCSGNLLLGGQLGGGLWDVILGVGSATANFFDGWGLTNPSQFDIEGTGYPLFAVGHQDLNVLAGFNGTIGSANPGSPEALRQTYSVAALGGAIAKLSADTMTLVASGTVTNLGEIVFTYPSAYQGWSRFLMASGTLQNMGRAYLLYGSNVSAGSNYSVTALGGAIATPTYSGDWTCAPSHGNTGDIGEFYGSIGHGHYTQLFSASGHSDPFNSINGILSGVSKPNGAWMANLVGPRFTLAATGHSPVTYASEAWSITLIGKADQAGDETVDEVRTSHLTQYPFNQIVRWGNSYYGINASGVFLLAGATFAGSNIVSVIKTGESDLGEPTLKRHRYLWIGGRLGADFTISFTAKELFTDPYTYVAQGGGAAKWRVKMGHGLESVFGSYTLTNTDGEAWEISELDPRFDVLRRSA